MTDDRATFEVKSWEEKPVRELPGGGKITRATVSQSYSGLIEGEGAVEYLMYYRDDGTAVFVGIERIEGAVGSKKGSFTVRHEGVFKEGVARSDWRVIAGSGTDELEGMQGDGSFEAGHDGKGRVRFEPLLA